MDLDILQEIVHHGKNINNFYKVVLAGNSNFLPEEEVFYIFKSLNHLY